MVIKGQSREVPVKDRLSDTVQASAVLNVNFEISRLKRVMNLERRMYISHKNEYKSGYYNECQKNLGSHISHVTSI